MSKFDLQKALTGEKVMTISGSIVTEITTMIIHGVVNVVGVYKGEVLRWNVYGFSKKGRAYKNLDLKMGLKMGSGFLYVYSDGSSIILSTKLAINSATNSATMCFDLSEYPIGFGLEETGDASRWDCL
tara:strand:+ start:240 stop:623 length:384 start_codon:yes stop_codon:yes gene_type:complete